MELTKKTIGQYLKERAAGIGDHTAMEMFGWSCSFAQLDETSDLGIYLPCVGEDRCRSGADQHLLPG